MRKNSIMATMPNLLSLCVSELLNRRNKKARTVQQRMNSTTMFMWLIKRFAPIMPKVKGMMRRIRGGKDVMIKALSVP